MRDAMSLPIETSFLDAAKTLSSNPPNQSQGAFAEYETPPHPTGYNPTPNPQY